EGHAASGAGDRQEKERAAPAEPIARDRDQERCRSAAREPAGDDDSDRRRVEPERREMQTDQHADHPDAERPQEGGREEEGAVGHPPRGSWSSAFRRPPASASGLPTPQKAI